MPGFSLLRCTPESKQMPGGWLKASMRLFRLAHRLANATLWSFPHNPLFVRTLSVSPTVFLPQPFSLFPLLCSKYCTSFTHICSFKSYRCSLCSVLFPDFFSVSSAFCHSIQSHITMTLADVLGVLEQLAPLSLAEPWDNVGLLVEPSRPRPIQTILLTNDLTIAVMEEAEDMSCDLIISYHPPLFRPFKRLVQKDWKQQLAIRALEAGIAVYSPHTSLDSVKGGINDWLIGGVGSGSVSVLHQAVSSAPICHKLEFTVRNHEELNTVLAELKEREAGRTFKPDSDMYSVSMSCMDSELTGVVQILSKHLLACQSLNILPSSKPPLPGCGQGRRSILDEPISVAAAVDRVKAHLGLSHVRLALGAQQTLESTVSTVAVCAGSGSSVLQGVKADLCVTGEMSHHEVLDTVAAGTSVILCDHSNSERGFLSVLRERLAVHLPESVSIRLSQKDRDPLEVV
ncbi:NIF3-like protein 1 isoform X2 [Brienomyrus brachyistius]|uniref:NIF3-like protein 1 isoform X2 n=1 Tax=Brienomyrus brachyistius TaxID=42636 RepID=UPI0020B3FE24|nr:NIF3-like protein 1 isoform X2 [Brienomyrus brachyistius]